MYCKHCGKVLSNDASFCDGCGKPISAKEIQKKNIVGLLLGVFAGICVFMIIMIVTLGKTSSIDLSTSNHTSLPNSNEQQQENSKWLQEGMYKVGTDIPAGEYFVCNTSSISCYIEVAADSSGQLTSIVSNDNVATFTFISVENGQYLTVRSGKFMQASDAQVPAADLNGYYSAGMYRVGIDIPAGEYKVISTNNNWCYLEVSKDCSGSLTSIITNDNINSYTYITVTDGQYLTVESGKFIPVD